MIGFAFLAAGTCFAILALGMGFIFTIASEFHRSDEYENLRLQFIRRGYSIDVNLVTNFNGNVDYVLHLKKDGLIKFSSVSSNWYDCKQSLKHHFNQTKPFYESNPAASNYNPVIVRTW
jgi:hypothetical protein